MITGNTSRKANNVARYFHDSDMDKHALAEYCEGLEDMLADRDITIKQTGYDLTDADFQEDTGKLNAMIQQRYQEQGQTISEEKQRSIEVDVRSIIMVSSLSSGERYTVTLFKTNFHRRFFSSISNKG